MQMPKAIFSNPKRWITAGVILAVVVAVGAVNNFFVMWAFLGLLFLFAFHEAMGLFELYNPGLYVYAAALWIAAYFYPNPVELFFLAFVILAAIGAYKKNEQKQFLMPFLYPGAGFLFLLVLYADFGIYAMLWLLAVVAATDIGAYFTGKSLGKRSFSPSSPNKTVEGVLGGIVLATVAGMLAGSMQVSFLAALLISFAVSLFSVFGDLYESYLKRKAGFKDSGTLLPGHGGILDRVDGYLFGAVIMVVLLRGSGTY